MTQRQLEDRFLREARYFERGIPPTWEHYSVRLSSGKIIVSDDVSELAEMFYKLEGVTQ